MRPARRPLRMATFAAMALLPLTALPAPPAMAQPRPPSVSWHSCVRGPGDSAGRDLDAAGGQCAEVTVPLDHTRPTGPGVTVAVARIPATDRRHRIGTLVVNEGGPADPVIDSLPDRLAGLGRTGARYDLVGVDPRFAGRSTPLDCHWNTGTYFRSAGTDRAAFDRTAAFQHDLARRCLAHAGELLPYASTRNVARDLDLVRAALGERRISYLGISYGSYLGEVYTQLFPGRTDRIVLDGVHDPRRLGPWPEYGTEEPNERALRDWARWAAPRDTEYGLGTTPDAVLATVDRIIAAARERPLSIGPYRLDEHLVPVVFYGSLGSDTEEADRAIAQITRTLQRAADTGHTDPDPDTAELLAYLLTDTYSAYAGAQTAYLCADTPGPRDLATFRHAVERGRHRHPLFGPVINGPTPCAFWPAPRERPTVIDTNIPALLVHSTGDPRIPYTSALAQHRHWPASRLLTLTGSSRHAVYGVYYANPCVNATVNRYLATGRLPTVDGVCRAAARTAGTRDTDQGRNS